MASIATLFEKAGYVNYPNMEVNKKYEPKEQIEVNSFNTEKNSFEWKRVTGLYYKGMSLPSDSYEIVIEPSKKSFVCTGKHAIFLPNEGVYRNVEDLNTKEEVLSPNGKETIYISKINYSFPILDIEVEDNHNYLSEGIVSHNSFGGTASIMAEGLKAVNPYLSRHLITSIFINQVRAKIGGMPGYGPQENDKVGGHALPFYSSWIARISNSLDIKSGNELIGKSIKIKNTKSKIGIPKREAMLDLNYSSGFNSDQEYVDYIINLEYVTTSGSWVVNENWGLKVQGRAKLLNYLKEHQDLFDDLKVKITQSFSSSTILDSLSTDDDEEDIIDPLLSEE